jgi:SET domain-containing protein
MYYIDKSNIHGNGVFALKNIKSGEEICAPKYIIIPKKFIESIDLINNNYSNSEIIFSKMNDSLGLNSYINKINFEYDNEKKYCYIIFLDNISLCNTHADKNKINIGIKTDKQNNILKFIIYAIKDINKDEELLLQYKLD